MAELTLRDVLGLEIRLKTVGSIGFNLSLPNAAGGRTNAYIEIEKAKELMQFLQEHLK